MSAYAEEAETEEARGYRFTWVNPIVGLEYWSIAEEGIAAADEKYGTDTQTVGPTEINVDEMVKQIDAAVAAQVDGIMTMALDPEALGQAIQRAVDAG
ncbi:substrate-binding domain-containing protein, partial [Parabacteroides distasonis]